MDPLNRNQNPSDDDRACANCGQTKPKMSSCACCGLVCYCCRDCQGAHWKDHKPLCIPKADRVPEPVKSSPRPPNTRESFNQDEECAICLDPLLADGSTLTLPCGHVFHGSCVDGLRARGVAKVCPLCRADLSPGPGKLYEGGARRYLVVEERVERGQTSWAELSTADQREMMVVAQLWKDAAAQGHIIAQSNLGVMYENGKGVQQDYAEAVKWYRRGAEQGFADAQCNLGFMCSHGQGMQQDYAVAVKWYRRAAEQGHLDAQCNMGLMYSNGLGAKLDYAEAVKWYRRAAKQGNAEAQYELGIMYAKGRGVQQDFCEAALWFEKAAIQGHDQAKLELEELRLFQARDSRTDPRSSDAQGVCACCAAQAPSGKSLKSCSRCGVVVYCGRDCQIAHWKARHKKNCKARKIF